MTNHPSFKGVLKSVASDGYDFKLLDEDFGYARWNKKLRDFVARWLKSQTDSDLWEDIAICGEKNGLSREACFYRVAVSAISALAASDPANVKNFSPKALRLQSDRFLHLARCAQSVAEHYRRRLKTFGQADHQSLALAEFYEDQADEFRQASAEALEWASTNSRQSGGKQFTREHLAFMRSLADSMQQNFEEPFYKVVAAITAVAYPQKNVTAEEARTACRRLPPIDQIPIRYQAPSYAAAGKALLEALELVRQERATGKLKKK